MKWEKREMGDLIDLYDNLRIPLSAIEREKKQGEYPYYGAQSIIDYVNEYLFDGDYILIAEDGENLRTRTQPIAFAVSGQFWVNNHAHIVKGKDNIADDLFIKYYLNNLDINPYVTGAAQPKLSQRNLKAIIVDTPSLPTQRKIASILSAYDDLIENNLKRIKLLEEKAFLKYKGIVREEKGLKKIPLAQLATVTSSKRIFLSDYVEVGIPFYRSKEIIAKSNFESIEKPLYITEERYTDIKEKFGVPVSGDLLITSVGTIGFVHLVNDDDGDFYFKDGNLIWIKNLLQQNLAYFLFFKFRTPEFKEMLNSVAIGSSQKALTIETVKKIEIEIPSNDSLIEFNQETKTIIKFIYNLQKQNTKLRDARDILLPKLMNGQIEV
ncbi:MAG: restriction endonuclease subunit S [Ferruginibacter sp.]